MQSLTKVSKHTPGPWMFYATNAGCDIYERLSMGKGECVAHVVGGVRGFEANAALIAAAPELLEALKVLVDRSLISNLEPYLIEPIRKAKEAIAKAEGRS